MARPKQLTLTLQTPALNNVCLDQTTAGSGTFTINGSLAEGGSVAIATAQRLDIESTGTISGVTFTITGTGNDNQVVSEEIAGPENNTVTTTSYFKTVTSVAVDGEVGTNTSIGISDEALSQTVPLNRYINTGYTLGVNISGTIDFTGQLTADNVQDATLTPAWVAITALTTKTADTQAEVSSPYAGFRMVINSYSSGATAAVGILQA